MEKEKINNQNQYSSFKNYSTNHYTGENNQFIPHKIAKSKGDKSDSESFIIDFGSKNMEILSFHSLDLNYSSLIYVK